MGSTQTLTVEWVSPDGLYCSPSNPRHNDDAVPHVAASLRRFGWQQPIVAKPNGEVIAGNTRLKAAQQLGMTAVPVARFAGDDLEATAFAIADNKTHEFSAWNEVALGQLLAELRAEDSLDGIGFDSAEVDQLLAQLEAGNAAEVNDPGPDEPPDRPITRPGDLWLLGQHRMLCGDSTDPKHVARLMDGEKAALVATDPPYLVDYTGDRPNDSGKDWSATYHEVDIKDADGFFRAVFTNILSVLGPGAAIYCWHAHKRAGLIQAVWADLEIVDHQQIIWVKPSPVFGRVYWHFRHEPCVMGWRKGQQPAHDGNHEYNSVWEVDWDGKARVQTDHPTSKPPELFARPMRKHTKPGAILFEPFCGSGSQVIAAETERRRCRAMEIEPAYVDVTIRRWEAATGQDATLGGTGKTFTQVSAERAGEPAT